MRNRISHPGPALKVRTAGSLAISLSITLLAFLCWSLCTASAHLDPEEEIEELTEQMKVQGPSPDLLIQRATEYRVLGKLADAAKDLEQALDLDRESVTARRELSQAYFALGKTNEALATVTRGLKSPGDDAEQASLLMVRAGILRARREYGKALADANDAISKYSQNVEWYLTRSQLQSLLKLKRDRVQGLQAGMRETGSGLLAAEWVDALIDDGQYAAASDKVESELQSSRYRAAWLIRRAKLALASGKKDAARADLLAALEELNFRLGTGAPDALLLVDRGLAYDLLEKRDEARRDYRAARDKGLSSEWVRERIRILREGGDDD